MIMSSLLNACLLRCLWSCTVFGFRALRGLSALAVDIGSGFDGILFFELSTVQQEVKIPITEPGRTTAV